MRVDLSSPNPAMVSIIQDPHQIITLDANFIIPPNRNKLKTDITFEQFRKIWVDPIFDAFPNLAVHEAVYEEFVIDSIKKYVDEKVNFAPPKLLVHKDSSLTPEEQILRDTIEDLLSPLTNYSPLIENKVDRGEVKSLSYMAVKGLLYFAAHDSQALQLIEKSEEWDTGLDGVQAIKMYELIYYLLKTGRSAKDSLRYLYRYQYYLTTREKSYNPEWGVFVVEMDKLYGSLLA